MMIVKLQNACLEKGNFGKEFLAVPLQLYQPLAERKKDWILFFLSTEIRPTEMQANTILQGSSGT